jgi:hypothetical protein
MVTTSAYNGPTNPPINFKPLAIPVLATTGADGAVTIQLDGMIGYPTPSSTQQTGSFVIVTVSASLSFAERRRRHCRQCCDAFCFIHEGRAGTFIALILVPT